MKATKQQEDKDGLILLDDRPKRAIDQDEFGREEFVRRLAKLLDRPPLAPSLVFSTLKLVPGAEPWATIVKTIFELVGESSSKIGKLEDYSIDKHRAEIQQAINRAKRPIIVIIDDLDRLTPQEVCQMIQVVKVVSDFDGITYLLAFEHGYLEHALKSLKIKMPDAYLEKIIQFHVSLPGVRSSKLEALFLGQLKSLEVKQQIPLESYSAGQIHGAIFEPRLSLLRNLRDVKRLMNNLQFLGDVALRHIQLWDLVALENIRLRSPSLWKFIKEHQTEITADGIEEPLLHKVSEQLGQNDARAERKKKLEKKVKKLLEPLGRDAEQVFQLYDKLFKRHVQIFDLGANITPASGRVCFIENLSSYFCYGVGLSGIENKRYFEFLQKAPERGSIIESILDYDTACSFIDTLSDIVSDAPMVDVPEGLERLGDLASSHVSESEEFAMWQGGLFGCLCKFIQELFTYQTVGKEEVIEILKGASSLPVKVALCRAVSGADPIIRMDQFREESRSLLKEFITSEVNSKVFDEVSKYLKSHPELRARWVLEMVRLYHKDNSAAVEGLVQDLLTAGQFLTALWLISNWGSIGGRVVLRVSDYELSRFGGREKFAEAIPRDYAKDLSQADRARLESFNKNQDLYVDTLEKPEMSLWATAESE